MAQHSIKEKIDLLTIEKRSYINGQYVNALNGEIIKKTSSIDGRDISGISACQQNDVDHAVDVALTAFKLKIWSNKTTQEKKDILLKLADLMELNKEQLALLDTIETGRAFKNYYYDSIPKAISCLRYFAESADKYYDLSIPPRTDASATICREPLGAVALITPWNDPMVVSIWKIAPALLMGNSVIIKPAEQSSFSILLFARLTKEAGIPDGIFNVVTGYGEIVGKALALHKKIAGVFFTGSSETGKKILQYSGQSNMKKVGLECGGKSPFIISNKCTNLTQAVKTLAKSMFYNQGQICSAPSRVFIDSNIKEEFIKLLLKESKNYIPQDPLDINSEVGCLINKQQQQRIQYFIDQGIKSGATRHVIGKTTNLHPESIYLLPTIFETNDNNLIIAQEEIFGPVLVVISYTDINAAITMANESKYGLAASIWSNDLDESYKIARELQAGIVHINSYGNDDDTVPFGGIKQSGMGKDKSMHAFDEYSYLKTTWIQYRQQ